MTAGDQKKLLEAGFMIVRTGELGMIDRKPVRQIKAKTKDNQNWHVLEQGFESNAARDRRMAELLKDLKTVED